MTSWDFACSDPIDMSIDNWTSGSVAVSGEPTSAIKVEVVPSDARSNTDVADQVQVSFEDGQLYIRGPRGLSWKRRSGLDLTVLVPAGSTCAAKTASADFSAVGDLSGLTVHTASGDITADRITGDITVQTASGDVMLKTVGASAAINTASGDVQLERVDGEARINTASGDVTIAACGGSAAVNTASGDVRLDGVSAGHVELFTVSGDLRVAVVPGIGVYLDLASTSGSILSDLDEAAEGQSGEAAARVKCRSLSGDVRITRAAGPSSAPASVPAIDR